MRCGASASVLKTVAGAVDASAVLTHREVCHEELEMEKSVRAALGSLPRKPSFRALWGGQTLYHLDDLQMDVAKALPQVRGLVCASRR